MNSSLKQAYFARGYLNEVNKNLQDAIKDNEAAITLYKDNDKKLIYLYNRIGLMQLSLKHYTEALKADSMVIQLDPNNYFALANMGFTSSAIHKHEQAIKYYTSSMPGYMEKAGTLSIIVGGRADAKRNLKRYDEAIVDYRYALSLNPDNKAANWNLALSYQLKGSYDLADPHTTKL